MTAILIRSCCHLRGFVQKIANYGSSSTLEIIMADEYEVFGE